MWNILLSAYTRGFPAEGKKWLGAVSLRPIDIAHTEIENIALNHKQPKISCVNQNNLD